MFEVKSYGKKKIDMQSLLSKGWFVLLLLSAYILVADCVHGMPFPRCISADYFGPTPITVKAGYSRDELDAFTPNDKKVLDINTGELSYGFHANQVVRWQNTGLITNGKDLIIRVNGSWTSCNKQNARESKRDNMDLQKLEQLRYEGGEDDELPTFDSLCRCDIAGNMVVARNISEGCSVSCESVRESDMPCWFTNGYGAYLLFRRPGDPDPNETLKLMRYPESPTVHLGYNAQEGVFRLNRSIDGECQGIALDNGWEVYIKILDKYYFDNAGGYSLEVLSGASLNSFTFFDDIYRFLRRLLLTGDNENGDGAAYEIFYNITQRSADFHNLVVSLLVLFIVTSSLLYIFGMVRDVYRDFIFRIVKISLVVMLLSPGSFRFFYDNFFGLFVIGLERLIITVSDFSGNARSGSSFDFMEDIFWTFMSYATHRKIAALLLSQLPLSIIAVLVIFIGMTVYLILCIYAFVIFLSGFIGIAFLIAVMPLFLVSILFSPLKHIFDGWLRFFVSLCIQSVMMYTLLALFASIIMGTFYRQLGFTVCHNKWLVACIPQIIPFIGGKCAPIFAWTTGQVFVPYTPFGSPSNIEQNIDNLSREGGRMKFTGGIYTQSTGTHATKRYVDYPYFEYDPILQGGEDAERIQDIQSGYLIDLSEVLMVLLLSFLMFALRNIAQELGPILARGGFGIGTISSIYDSSPVINWPMQRIQKYVQIPIGYALRSVGEYVKTRPDKLAGGAAKLVGRVPVVGGFLEAGINTSRKMVDTAVLTTQLITSPKHDVAGFEKRIYKVFGIDEQYLASDNKLYKYLEYYRKSVGSHLGYVLGYTDKYGHSEGHMGYIFKDAIKFSWEHASLSVASKRSSVNMKLYNDGIYDKDSVKFKDDLFYMAKIYRKDFLKKLRDKTIGVEAKPKKYKPQHDERVARRGIRPEEREDSENEE